jgi:pimeloyl-ACP methyl ester carboxylesterase
MTTHIATRTLVHADAELVHDVHGPLPTADGRPPLLMIGQPMHAGGFRALVEQFPDRTSVTYDPRGIARSIRTDGRTDQRPEQQAADVHAIIEAVGGGPVEMFASSGGAITALALVAAHPDDLAVLVAHEPPLGRLLPDAAAAGRAENRMRATYQQHGHGAGAAAFMQFSSWVGEFTDAYFARPAPDPAALGMPAADDGRRDDELLSERTAAMTAYVPDAAAIAAAPTRVVIGVGQESRHTFTGRAAIATAQYLGCEAVEFPSHHGGFVGPEYGWPGEPEEFGRALRKVLDAS